MGSRSDSYTVVLPGDQGNERLRIETKSPGAAAKRSTPQKRAEAPVIRDEILISDSDSDEFVEIM